jgi:hypothetical protein
MQEFKSGQFVSLNNMMYLFLGYSDYKKKYCVLADKHGNKLKIESIFVSEY